MGCVSNCEGCVERGCDYTCPNNQDLYRRRLADVDGLEEYSIPTLLSPDAIALPKYLPLIYHGSSRERPLDCDFVAIPLFRVPTSRPPNLRLPLSISGRIAAVLQNKSYCAGYFSRRRGR